MPPLYVHSIGWSAVIEARRAALARCFLPPTSLYNGNMKTNMGQINSESVRERLLVCIGWRHCHSRDPTSPVKAIYVKPNKLLFLASASLATTKEKTIEFHVCSLPHECILDKKIWSKKVKLARDSQPYANMVLLHYCFDQQMTGMILMLMHPMSFWDISPLLQSWLNK